MAYDFGAYCDMLADEVRAKPCAEALRRVVGPDSIVLDLGAGTGLFALLAVQVPVRRVYAIDANPAVRFGEALALEDGLEDRARFLKSRREEVDRLALTAVGRRLALEAIPHDIQARFPRRFAAWEETLGHVGGLSKPQRRPDSW